MSTTTITDVSPPPPALALALAPTPKSHAIKPEPKPHHDAVAELAALEEIGFQRVPNDANDYAELESATLLRRYLVKMKMGAPEKRLLQTVKNIYTHAR
jgi:hypothetical protein